MNEEIWNWRARYLISLTWSSKDSRVDQNFNTLFCQAVGSVLTYHSERILHYLGEKVGTDIKEFIEKIVFLLPNFLCSVGRCRLRGGPCLKFIATPLFYTYLSFKCLFPRFFQWNLESVRKCHPRYLSGPTCSPLWSVLQSHANLSLHRVSDRDKTERAPLCRTVLYNIRHTRGGSRPWSSWGLPTVFLSFGSWSWSRLHTRPTRVRTVESPHVGLIHWVLLVTCPRWPSTPLRTKHFTLMCMQVPLWSGQLSMCNQYPFDIPVEDLVLRLVF